MLRVVRDRCALNADGDGRAVRSLLAACALSMAAGTVSARQDSTPLIDQSTAPAKAPGAPEPRAERPEAARRIVRVFDFEEQASNPFQWPRHWLRAQDGLRSRAESGTEISFKRPGFPSWNLAELDYTSPAFAGTGSVKLPTKGGSTALRLEPGVIPVFPDADYLVTARVRTSGLTEARARVEAVFLDSQLKPIESSRTTSELIVSEGLWSPVEIELRGSADNAAFLGLELSLLQPEQQGGVIPGYRPPPQEYTGAAWFDDVTVAQLPRIELACTVPGGVFVAPEKPELNLEIRDLTGEELTAQVTLIDSRGTVVDRLTREIGAGRAHAPWTPAVPRFGWYRAALGVFNKDALVGKAHADFLWLDADALGTSATRRLTDDRRRFGVMIDPAPVELGAEVENVLRRIGSGSVVLPAWSADLSANKAKDFSRSLALVVDPLLEHGQSVTLVLPRMPEELAAITRLDPDDPWRVLAGDRKVWGPFLEPILERFGQRVQRWQVGGPGDERALLSKTLADDVIGAERALATLVPSPVLCVPWRVDQNLRPEVASPGSGRPRVSALVPREAPPGSIARTVDSWRSGPAGTELEFVFEPSPEDLYGFGPGLVELARRTIEIWAADRAGPRPAGAAPEPQRAPIGAVLLAPWTMDGKSGTQIEPRPELGVWSTLARRLSDRRVVGEFPAGPGLKCFILAPAPGSPEDMPGALVGWNDSAPADAAVLKGYVGRGPVTVVDLFGNVSDAPLDEMAPVRVRAGDAAPGAPEKPSSRRPGIRVPLTPEPVFIEGVDARLVKFLSSVRIDPPLLTPTNDTHEHSIVFDNPWNVPLEVKSFVASPGGYETPDGTRDRRWRITPRAGRAMVQPGEQGRIPITVAFAASEEAGLKEFVLDLEVTADRDYGSIRTTTTVELGLPQIMLELVALHTGADVVVEAHITNRGTHPMDLDLTATAPDQPRIKAPVSQLPAGRQAVRRFPYSKGYELLKGKRVSVAVLEPETGARIVRSVAIE